MTQTGEGSAATQTEQTSAPLPPPQATLENVQQIENTSSESQLPTHLEEEPLSYDMSTLSALELHQRTQEVLDEAASERPLMSEVLPLALLRAEYENGSQSFVNQIDSLKERGYDGIRRTRGDGDCFYRSLAFAWIERLLDTSPPEKQTLDVAKALSLLDDSLNYLETAGFEKLVYEDFYDVLTSVIRQIVVPEPNGSILTRQVLLEAFQDIEVSNCIVVFLRLLTSATIRTDPETYEPFLFNPETGDDVTPQEFCERFVEACGKEADHVQITALTRALRLNIDVAYLDGHGTTVNFVDFRPVPPEDVPNPPVLLYRPGHYDILVRHASSSSS